MAQERLDVVFYTEGLPFDGGTLAERSLGGAETAVVQMAREMARLDNRVRVFCRCERPGRYEGVEYHDLREFGEFVGADDCDVFVCSRHFGALAAPMRSKLNVLWCHDVMTPEVAPQLSGLMYKIDWIFALSEFHKEQIRRHLEAPEARVVVTRNGVDLALVEAATRGVERDPHKLIYTSRPERGLEVLLDIWPRLKRAQPELRLAVASYAYPEADAQMRQFTGRLAAKMAALEDVRHLGHLDKAGLYREIASARAMVYPSVFPEVSCISALEAAGCGTPIVASKYCALKETVQDAKTGLLMPGDPRSEEYQERFAQAVLRVVEDDELWRALSESGQAWVRERYQWSQVAAEWQEGFEAFFRSRDKEAVWRHLVHHSDLVAAKLVCPERPTGAEFLDDPESYRQHYEAGAELAEVDLGPQGVTGTLRFQWLLDQVRARPGIERILDVGAGLGWFAIGLTNADERLQVTGLEVSERLVERAQVIGAKYAQRPQNTRYMQGALEDVDEAAMGAEQASFDAALVFEVLEHVPDVQRAIGAAERWVKPWGWMFVTIPFGPWESLSFARDSRRFHVRGFTRRDVEQVFGDKAALSIEHVRTGCTPRGEELGYWLVAYQRTITPAGQFDDRRKLICRPRQTVSVCMIVKDAEDTLHRCLKSVRGMADELIICDTGSTDSTVQIARQYTDKVCEIGWRDDFGWARNQSVERATGDWILWIDADEYLVGAEDLDKYLRENMYNGYVIRQHHQAIDARFSPDVPVRLYRNGLGIRFYGVIHEHPEMRLNEGISPAVALADVNIVHDGYITEAVRRGRFLRNLPLLMKDREQYPQRRLGLVFLERDYIHLARYDMERHGGRMTDQAARYLEQAARIHRDHFRDEEDPLHGYSLPLYQGALELLGAGYEVGYFLGVGLDRAPAVSGEEIVRRRFEGETELREYLDRQVGRMFRELERDQEFAFEEG